jgi:hypothetical protein
MRAELLLGRVQEHVNAQMREVSISLYFLCERTGL